MKEFFNQVEEIRGNIEKMEKHVIEVKKLNSTLLASASTDDS